MQLTETAAQVDATLAELVHTLTMSPAMREVVDYTLCAPGKRIRAALLLWIDRMLTGRVSQAACIAASALEMVHTYSLVHDDLPAMDDDDLRRGRPTCHKAFDEASAILAGDALLTLAFEVLASRIEDGTLALALVRELAAAAGPGGMIAGQMADLRAENQKGTLADLDFIHVHKTAKMFECAARMGALCARGSSDQVSKLGHFGLKLGLGFQISDDILDVSATSGQLGKTPGKDAKAGKLTFPALVGLAGAQERAKALTLEALDVLKPFGPDADCLRDLARVMLHRQK